MANQYVLNLEEEPDKKLKKSYLRLSKNTQELQKSLNDMFSLQIHVEIVVKILAFGSDDSDLSQKEKMELIPLKTNTLQLLIEKITSYN